MLITTIVTLHLFFGTVYLILKEPEIVLKNNKKIILDYSLVSISVIVLLIISGIASLSTVRQAMLPKYNIVPWQIIIVFFGSAYICTSLDMSGLLGLFAYKLVLASKENGKKLFLNLVFLTAVLTIFTSNDIVTLTLTPMIVYISSYSGINPLPYLITVFFASNTWSMFFYIGNPTNIIAAQAFKLGFFEYFKYMVLPTLIAGVTSTFMFFKKYKKSIPEKIDILIGDTELSPIKNGFYAGFTLILFVLFFVLVALGDFVDLPLWKVILLFSGAYLFLNLVFSDTMSDTNEILIEFKKFKFNLSFFVETIRAVPWKMLPMIVAFFTFVHLFTVFGLTRYIGNLMNFRNELLGTVATSYITAFASNVMINQPMTILFAQALQGKPLNYAFALVLGSNIGGNITLFGALAGVMWKKILANHGVEMNTKIFTKETFWVSVLTILFASLSIYFVTI